MKDGWCPQANLSARARWERDIRRFLFNGECVRGRFKDAAPYLMDILAEFDIQCAYCGESFRTLIDTSQGDYSTIEDCAVCCRPMQLEIRCKPGEVIDVEISPA